MPTWPPCWLLAHPRPRKSLPCTSRPFGSTCGQKPCPTLLEAIVLFGSSKFLGRDELGHSRTTVGLTRSGGVTVVAGPPDPYGLIGMIQTIYCYYSAALVIDSA